VLVELLLANVQSHFAEVSSSLSNSWQIYGHISLMFATLG